MRKTKQKVKSLHIWKRSWCITEYSRLYLREIPKLYLYKMSTRNQVIWRKGLVIIWY